MQHKDRKNMQVNKGYKKKKRTKNHWNELSEKQNKTITQEQKKINLT